MLQNCGIDALIQTFDKTISMLWCTVRPSLTLPSELEQKSGIYGPHIGLGISAILRSIEIRYHDLIMFEIYKNNFNMLLPTLFV